jgi:hypothetical protein
MHPALRTETPDDLQSEDLISMRRVSQRYGRGLYCELASTFWVVCR